MLVERYEDEKGKTEERGAERDQIGFMWEN